MLTGQLFHQFVETVFASRHQTQLIASVGQLNRQLPADAGTRSDDNCFVHS